MIGEQITRSDRFLARYFGIASVRHPVNWPDTDPTLDFVMAFHYCRERREFRFDRHYDPLSKAEGFQCGGCGRIYRTREFFGLLAFHIEEAGRIAFSKKFRFQRILFVKLFFFGLGKHMPDDRGGKTSGELEYKATMTTGVALIEMMARLIIR